jgi:hypothetical protein
LRRAEAGGEQFHQADRGGIESPREFRHEPDAARTQRFNHIIRVRSVRAERLREKDRLSCAACRPNRFGAAPRSAQHVHRINVVALDQAREAIDGVALEFRRLHAGTVRDFVVKCANLKLVGHSEQGLLVPPLPGFAQSHHA